MTAIARHTGIPGINTAALNAIQDENARLVIQSLVDGLNVRNGVAGKGGAAFVTRDDLGLVRNEYTGLINGLSALVRRVGDSPIDPNDIARIINDLQGQVMASPLFVELGTTIEGINTDLVEEVQERIESVQQVADDLIAEATARLAQDDVIGGDITTLQSVTADHAEELTGILTRVDGAESSIIILNSTTASQATALVALNSQMDGAESNITTLFTTTATQASALTSLDTRVDGAESNISTLFTTTATHASSLTSISTKVAAAEAAIVTEQTTRANADNAISTSMSTQFATVNTTIAGISSTLTTTATLAAANASAITTVESDVDGLTAAVETNYDTMVSLNGTIEAKYTVKVDANGYVAGYGLIATANNATPSSEFIVRADKFSIGSSSGPSITPRVPFIVLTSTDAAGNPPGVYIDFAAVKLAAITKAFIAEAEIDTLRIQGNAVTIPAAVTPSGTVTITTFNTWYDVGSITVDYGSNVPGNVLVFGTCNFTFSSGTGETIYELELLHNGSSLGSVLQSAPGGYAFSASGAVTATGTSGSNTFTMRARRVYGGTIHYAAGRALATWGIRR